MERTPDLTLTHVLERYQLLQSENEKLRKQTETDKLTGLGNLLALERRTHARDGWFVMADLNNFKHAQDSHPEGHAYGDRILREFAHFLQMITHTGRGFSNERVATRKGGDEFVIWCPKRYTARRIRNQIREWRSLDGKVSASAGLGKDLATADCTMYINKQDRRASRS